MPPLLQSTKLKLCCTRETATLQQLLLLLRCLLRCSAAHCWWQGEEAVCLMTLLGELLGAEPTQVQFLHRLLCPLQLQQSPYGVLQDLPGFIFLNILGNLLLASSK